MEKTSGSPKPGWWGSMWLLTVLLVDCGSLKVRNLRRWSIQNGRRAERRTVLMAVR
ncbi:hypothetical protein SISNIDRAFT_460059 [Sistotremastrum niveocremeum HHB9708]|uniref:Uncharacterized protein n=2 Tax=Sistotremastraceae TaxID=3402574 RepID=A0A164NZ18_9AGAM|nr:hypothetical protein SISNIDRAFT_460059 [Sistotremastrum niveocremeum HHB9708]KZT36513.1 hypothetical protein SISSUDRAFT_1049745 [Sistotremastrum suecicum HHB10207 ss-3]